MNKVAFKLINYNKKVALICKRINMILLFFVLITSFLGGLIEKFLLHFYNIKFEIPEFLYIIYSILTLIIIVLSLKTAYHENKWNQIGRLEISETCIRIESNEKLIEYDFDKFNVSFIDSGGYEGRSNWRFPSKVGMLSFDSGVNNIYFVNKENTEQVFEYSLFVENKERLELLLSILRSIRAGNK